LVIALVTVGLVLVIGFLIIAETKDQVIGSNPCAYSGNWFNTTSGKCCESSTVCATTNGTSYAYNGTSQTQTALAEIPGWLPIIVITVIGALLLSLVAMFRGR